MSRPTADQIRVEGLSIVVNELTTRVAVAEMENARLRAEVEAFREAIRTGDGPSCEEVCQRECIGVCGVFAVDDET